MFVTRKRQKWMDHVSQLKALLLLAINAKFLLNTALLPMMPIQLHVPINHIRLASSDWLEKSATKRANA